MSGLIHKVDEQGRITLPVELLRALGIGEKDRIEVMVKGKRIALRKF